MLIQFIFTSSLELFLFYQGGIVQTITGLPSQNYQTSSTNEATQVDLAVNITQTPMSTTSTDTSTPTTSTDTTITTTSSAKTLGTTTTPPSGKAKL